MAIELRDYYAVAALAGLLQQGFLQRAVNPDKDTPAENYTPLAEYAFKIADAMLQVRDSSKERK